MKSLASNSFIIKFKTLLQTIITVLFLTIPSSAQTQGGFTLELYTTIVNYDSSICLKQKVKNIIVGDTLCFMFENNKNLCFKIIKKEEDKETPIIEKNIRAINLDTGDLFNIRTKLIIGKNSKEVGFMIIINNLDYKYQHYFLSTYNNCY